MATLTMIRVYELVWSSADFSSNDGRYQLIKSHLTTDQQPWMDPAWLFDSWPECAEQMKKCLGLVPEAALIVTSTLMPESEFRALPERD